jgi:hypothetical protein
MVVAARWLISLPCHDRLAQSPSEPVDTGESADGVNGVAQAEIIPFEMLLRLRPESRIRIEGQASLKGGPRQRLSWPGRYGFVRDCIELAEHTLSSLERLRLTGLAHHGSADLLAHRVTDAVVLYGSLNPLHRSPVGRPNLDRPPEKLIETRSQRQEFGIHRCVCDSNLCRGSDWESGKARQQCTAGDRKNIVNHHQSVFKQRWVSAQLNAANSARVSDTKSSGRKGHRSG